MAEILRTPDHSIHFNPGNFRENLGEHVLQQLLALPDDGRIALMFNGVESIWARWRRGALALKPANAAAREVWAATATFINKWISLVIIPPNTTSEGSKASAAVLPEGIHGASQVSPAEPTNAKTHPVVPTVVLPGSSENSTHRSRLFDLYIMVDWSGNGVPKKGKDSIWIGYANAEGEIALSNPNTRECAFAQLMKLLCPANGEQKKRVLLGFDFAYGYPQGFADAIGLELGQNECRWKAAWRLFHDLAFGPQIGGGDRENHMNKWAMGNALNQRFNRILGNPLQSVRGPFWGRPDWTVEGGILLQLPANVRDAAPFAEGHRKGKGKFRRKICQQCGIEPPYPFLAMTSPGFPLQIDGGALSLPKLRWCEQGHGAQETWKLCGNGAVGGQSLTGIPYLYHLLIEPDLVNYTQRVWPYTTGFADPTLGIDGPLVVHAEIFPNAVQIPGNIPAAVPRVKDARQVWTLVNHARRLDALGELNSNFAPARVAALDQNTRRRLIDEEGWILFVK